MEYRILGPVEVELEGGPPLSVKGKKPRALLALLILRRSTDFPSPFHDAWSVVAQNDSANPGPVEPRLYISRLGFSGIVREWR